MARTRAGLSGRPTCRPGVICPGLSAPQGWPLAAMPAGLPVGTLRPCLTSAVELPRAAGAALRSSVLRPTAGRCCLPVLAVGFYDLGAELVPVLGRGGGATLRGLPRFNKESWPQAIHLSGGGADRRLGEPRRGAPVADRFAAFRFAQVVELSTTAKVLRFYICFKSFRTKKRRKILINQRLAGVPGS